MRARPLQIHWHERQPVYSIDFSVYVDVADTFRFATAGGDSHVRMWRWHNDPLMTPPVTFLCTLRRHTQGVNVVRFSPSGHILASGGDDGLVMLWRKSVVQSTDFGETNEEEPELETWIAFHQIRLTDVEDLYDLAWSPNGKYVAAGLTDNTVHFCDTETGKSIRILKDHAHFVQGVAWDPLDQFIASQSSDRTVRLYTLQYKNQQLQTSPFAKYDKRHVHTAAPLNEGKKSTTAQRLYHDETLGTFFRRLTWSLEGSLLFTVTGLYSTANASSHGVYVYSRNRLKQSEPVLVYAGMKKAPIAVRCHPFRFQLRSDLKSLIDLPFRMVFAVVTMDSLLVYDTQQPTPLCQLSHLHYAALTDVAWSPDGLYLLMTSADGFCSVVVFDQNELGQLYECPDGENSAPMGVETPVQNENVVVETKENCDLNLNVTSAVKETVIQQPPPVTTAPSAPSAKRRITPQLISTSTLHK